MTCLLLHAYEDNHKAQILHIRLRTHCCSLNMDLFSKNITYLPLCSCGAVENASHFFRSISYFMGMLDFHMQLMSSYFRRYRSTYWILNDLCNGTAFIIYKIHVMVFEYSLTNIL